MCYEMNNVCVYYCSTYYKAVRGGKCAPGSRSSTVLHDFVGSRGLELCRLETQSTASSRWARKEGR